MKHILWKQEELLLRKYVLFLYYVKINYFGDW